VKPSRLDSVWFTLALWLALGYLWAGTYAFADAWTSQNPPPLATKPAAKAVKPESRQNVGKTVGILTVAGHYHRCYRCGNEWGHTSASHGNVNAHRCPACGAGPVWNISRYGPVQLLPPKQLKAKAATLCPD
jgi:hypothetical protein